MSVKTKRIDSVDFVKLVALLCLIVYYKSFYYAKFDGSIYRNPILLLGPLTMFHMPFFFMISGYFFGVKVQNGSSIANYFAKNMKRLVPIFIIWFLVYTFSYEVPAMMLKSGVLPTLKIVYLDFIHRLTVNPLGYILKGSRPHLWFLPALFSALVITSIFVYKRWIRALVVVAVGLYLFSMLTNAYSMTPLGIRIRSLSPVNGPFVSTVFFVTGYLLTKYRPNSYWLFLGFYLFLFGGFIWHLEMLLLVKFYGPIPYTQYIIGTYLMGLGATLVALSGHNLISSIWLGKLGCFTLGAYLSQVIFVSLFEPTDAKISHLAWKIVHPFIILTLAIIFTYILSRNRYTRKIVM